MLDCVTVVSNILQVCQRVIELQTVENFRSFINNYNHNTWSRATHGQVDNTYMKVKMHFFALSNTMK